MKSPPDFEKQSLPAWKFGLTVLLPLLGAYMTTTDIRGNHHIDAVTNSVTAWALGTKGTVCIDEISEVDLDATLGKIWWFLDGEHCPVSAYSPGASALAAPLYAIFAPDLVMVEAIHDPFPGKGTPLHATIPLPALWPANLVAATTTALAMMMFALAIRPLAEGDREARAAALIAGLGTTAWSVSADALWQHGPAVLWMGVGFALASAHPGMAGFSYGAAVFTRPQIAPIAAVVGLTQARQRRSWPALISFGLAAASGLAAYLLYTRLAFGSWFPSFIWGSFSRAPQEAGMANYLKGLILAAVDPARGFLVWSPFLILLLPGLAGAWRMASPLVRSSAIGGLLYFLLILRGNVWHGGLGQFTYRYPIEMLYSSAPLLFLSYRYWVATRPQVLVIFKVLVVASIAAHGIGAITY